MTEDIDGVIVSGAGPVGLVTALKLAPKKLRACPELGGWSRGIRQGPMIDAYPLNERSKPRVGVQPVEKRVLREEIDQRRSILHGVFQK